MAQRNLDIEQLQTGNYNQTNFDPEWLTPKETSLKSEKNVPLTNQIPIQPTNNRLKHINIDDNNNISLTIQENKTPKKVSWDDNNITEEPITNIFQKLKKQPNSLEDDQKKYVEQQSRPLPEVKQEQIIRDTITTSQLTPIIPKNEMAKQLNEMNEKIDNLYEMVTKLTNLVQDVLTNKVTNNE